MDTPSRETLNLDLSNKAPEIFTVLLSDKTEKEKRSVPGSSVCSCRKNSWVSWLSSKIIHFLKSVLSVLWCFSLFRNFKFSLEQVCQFFSLWSEVFFLLRKPSSHQDYENMLLFFLWKQP